MSIDYRGNPWDVSVVSTSGMYGDSCVNTPSRCEASCAAFDSTFPTTPAGYSIANPSGTTASGLGVRRCADGYVGVAEVTCGGGRIDAYCASSDRLGTYTTRGEAETACEGDASCLTIHDRTCDDTGDWSTCSSAEGWSSCPDGCYEMACSTLVNS